MAEMQFLSCLPFRFLRRLKNWIKGGNPKTQPDSTVAEFVQRQPSASTIEKLPVEMQQHIASFLTPDSAACLTLCSKSLQRVIGQQSWIALQTKDRKNARMSFLSLLQKDLHEWLPCYHCEKLHPLILKPDPYVYVHAHARWMERNEHPCSYLDGYLLFGPHFGFRFQHAQMAMKLYRLRAPENPFLDSLSHAESWYTRSPSTKNVAHYHTSARIANDDLIMKLEYRYILDRGEGYDESRILCEHVCPHWKRGTSYDDLTKRTRCLMSHESGQSCPGCTGMVQCQSCSTEFIVALLDCNWSPGGRALYFTVWKNLGPCDTPFDIRWRSQLRLPHDRLLFRDYLSPRTMAASFVPGSILRAFEDSADSRVGVGGLSSKWPLDSDVEFSRIVADNRKEEIVPSSIEAI